MCKVDVILTASTSKYWAWLKFIDKAGVEHQKQIEGSREATINSNMLQALLEALCALNRPCMIDIYTDSDYIASAIRLGWLQAWKKNGWKSAKGIEIKNPEQWEQLEKKLARHTVKVIKTEK